MVALSRVPKAALAAGVPPRYQYWFGRSGCRYLFTCTEAGSIADFADAVAIVVSAGEIVWTGEAAALASAPRGVRFPADAAYVHLLAATSEDRRAVIEDLRPADRTHLRLAA